MSKKLLTQSLRTALLAVALAMVLSPAARADVTVYVVADEAPYIHAWNDSGTNLNDNGAEYPGNVITEKEVVDGVRYYKKTYTGQTSVNFILSKGGNNADNTKTNNIEGITGTVYLQYDGSKTAFGTIPPQARYTSNSDNIVYFANTLGSDDNVRAILDGTSYNMTKVGSDGAGKSVFMANFGSTSGSKIQFQSTYTSQEFEYTKYGYYSTYDRENKASWGVDGWTLNSTNFPDANLLNALKTAAADYIQDNFITTNTALKLDISGKSISNATGVEKFSNLRHLNISDNKISYLKLTDQAHLQYLDLSKNTSIYGFSANTATTSNPTVNLTKGCPLYYLDASGCTKWGYFSAIESSYGVTTLEHLNLANCKSTSGTGNMGWSDAIQKQTGLKYLNMDGTLGSNTPKITDLKLDTLILSNNPGLKWQTNVASHSSLTYLDLSNTGLSSTVSGTAPNWSQLTNLETLIIANNKSDSGSNTAYLNQTDVSPLSKLKYFDISGSDLYLMDQSSNGPYRMLHYLTPTNNPLLETLIISNAKIGGSAQTITGFKNLKKIDVSNNTSMTKFGVSDCPKLEEIVFTNDTKIETLTLSNNGYTSTNDMPALTGLTATSAVVDLSDNLFTEVPTLANVSVKGLNLNNNKISSIENVGTMTGLAELYVQNNNFPTTLSYTGKSIPQIIDFGNNNITELDLSDDALTDIVLPNGLTKLTLKNNSGLKWNANVAACSSLTYLDLTNTGLSSTVTGTAPNWSQLTNLETLILANNKSGSDYLNQTDVSPLSKLKYFDISGSDLYLMDQSSNGPYRMLHYLTPTNNPLLETLIVSNSKISNANPISGFQNLKKIDISNNGIAKFEANNCPALEEVYVNDNANLATLTLTGGCNAINKIDVTNNPLLTTIALTDNGLSNSPVTLNIVGVDDDTSTTTNLKALDLSQNAYSSIPAIPAVFEYLYLNDNEFAENLTLDGGSISLKGIALSNKSSVAPIKTFTATTAGATTDEWSLDFSQTTPVLVRANDATADGSNMTLEAINLSGNSSLEEIHVNGFKAITKLASATDMTTDAGKGLYVKGLTGLKTLDISNNRIEILGQDACLSRLSGLEELDASHNMIRTLTNYSVNGRYNSSTSSYSKNYRSMYGGGDYTAATCPNIEDLTGLKKLNLSHNLLCDSIHLYKNVNLEWLDVSNNRQIAFNRGVGATRYYRVPQDGSYEPWAGGGKTIKADIYTGDTNDTIGLRRLNLFYNTKLKYLNISTTSIQNTAKDPTFIDNPVGPENLTNTQTNGNVPHMILLNHCENLETFICNYNGMKSLGIGSSASGNVTGCPKLKYVEAKEMRGQDPAVMQGEIRISANNPLIEHFDVSGGNWDYVGAANGADLSHLKYLNVSNNYTTHNDYTYSNGTWNATGGLSTHGQPYILDVTSFTALDTLIANNTPYLDVVNASGTTALKNIDVTQDANNNTLRELYVDNAPELSTIGGLATLNHLEVYHANDSHFTGEFVMPAAATATLRDLNVSNSSLDDAETLNNITTLNIGNYGALQTLQTQNNPNLTALDIALCSSNLKVLDFGNCHIDNSGIPALSSASALTHFNCANDAPADGTNGNWLTDLDLSSASNLFELSADNNELYTIKVHTPCTNLSQVSYANNHVSGTDFTGLVITDATIFNQENNGRKIRANKANFTKNGTTYEYYYFQLEQLDQDAAKSGGAYLLDQQTKPYLHIGGDNRVLGNDGFDLSKVTFPEVNNEDPKISKTKSSFSPSDLDASKIEGTIVILDPEDTDDGLKRIWYNYNNDSSIPTQYYLDFSAEDVVTSIENISSVGVNTVSVRPALGGLEIVAPAGAVLGIFDMTGRLVQQVTINESGSATIDGLSPGIYIVNGVKAQVK